MTGTGSSIAASKLPSFPRDKWLGNFDFDANPNINPATIHTLATGDWIRKEPPLCLIGDSGAGKSHLLIGLGTAAADEGYRVKYTMATRLVNELVEAGDEKVLASCFTPSTASKPCGTPPLLSPHNPLEAITAVVVDDGITDQRLEGVGVRMIVVSASHWSEALPVPRRLRTDLQDAQDVTGEI